VIEWLEDFYSSDTVRNSLRAVISPLFSRYAQDVWRAEGGTGQPPDEFVAALAASYVDHHLESSRIQLQEVLTDAPDPPKALADRLAEWIEKRPGKVAANETVRTGNAIALEQMRSSGVERKVWRSSGSDTCPYCKGLNGRTVEITQDFFTPDDSYQPEGAESPLTFTSNVGHPPCHAGCDCSIVSG
jgi:hypothetical protein